jgi:serine/threonine protein kinase
MCSPGENPPEHSGAQQCSEDATGLARCCSKLLFWAQNPCDWQLLYSLAANFHSVLSVRARHGAGRVQEVLSSNRSSIVCIVHRGIAQSPLNQLVIINEMCESDLMTLLLTCEKHRGSVNQQVLVSLARQIAASISILHSRGVIHRDLKPQALYSKPMQAPVYLIQKTNLYRGPCM